MSNRSTSEWHLDEPQLRAYADGGLDFAAEASVETHLLTCPRCRGLVRRCTESVRTDSVRTESLRLGSERLGSERLEAVWTEVVDHIDVPKPTLLERLLVRAAVPQSTARLLAATPSLRTSWLASVAVALSFSVVAAHSAPHGSLVFLLLAPVLPVLGVAAAYGRHADPAYDIGLAAPFSSFRLLLLRSSAVLTATALLAGITAAFLPAQAWVATAWLLPALALTGATLALSTRYDATWSAGVVAGVWVLAVGGPIPVVGVGYAAFDVAGQLTCLVVTLASCVVLLRRAHALNLDLGRTL